MSIRVGIDVGGSTTKIVGFNKDVEIFAIGIACCRYSDNFAMLIYKGTAAVSAGNGSIGNIGIGKSILV